jgi:uroporphyrinogen decarboxylase
LHLCGPNLNFDLVDAFPVAAVSWAATEPSNPGLAAGRERSGRTVLGGVPELDALASGTPEDVAAAVRAATDETGGRGLIVGPGCSVPPSASDANLAALSTRPV